MLFQGDRMVISNKSPESLKTIPEVMAEIKSALANLKEMSSFTDFKDQVQYDNFAQNVAYLKRFYTRAERIALDAKKVR